MGDVVPFRPKVEQVKLPMCFRFGVMAAERGIAFLNNPFRPGTEQHREWADGWCSHMMGVDCAGSY